MAESTTVRLDREEIAKREIGRTDITRGTAWALVLFFLLVITVPPFVQLLLDRREGRAGAAAIAGAPGDALAAYRSSEGSAWDRLFAANAVLLDRMQAYETDLEDESLLAQAAIPRMQAFTAGRLGLGNEQAYVGRDGWLFYRPGVDYLTGRGFLDAPRSDPRVAILDFKRQLAARGIELVIMPVPVKAVVRPDRLSSRYERHDAPLKNPSYDAFVAEMRAAGVRVFDPTDLLVGRSRNGDDVFLKTDTHWRPADMQSVAAELAGYLQTETGVPAGDPGFRTEPVAVQNHGDIAVMLKLPAGQTLYPPESVELRMVLTPGGELWRPSRNADVLLLGDSFANIYSLGAMSWGESAGLAEQLSLELGRPVDTLLRNDAGAHASREMLARELARGNDRLAGKRVVVWQFAARELSVGDWKLIDLTLGEARPARFFAPEPDAVPARITGLVEAVSPIPRPGSVPYKDHVFAVHLSELAGERVPAGAQAVVYLRSMADGALTPAARIRAGDRITLDLVAWDAVAARYERFNRSELDDEDLQLEPPCWGEPVQ